MNEQNIKIEKKSYSGKDRISKSNLIYKLALTAMLTAFAFVLGGIGSAIGIFDPWTNGGSVSLSSLPLVFIGLICGWQYGLLGGVVYAGIDMLMDNGYCYLDFYTFGLYLGIWICICRWILQKAILKT